MFLLCPVMRFWIPSDTVYIFPEPFILRKNMNNYKLVRDIIDGRSNQITVVQSSLCQKCFLRSLVGEYKLYSGRVFHPTPSNIVVASLLFLQDEFHILQNLCGHVTALLWLSLARPDSRLYQDCRRLGPLLCNLVIRRQR